jgi:hypothetical protein
VAKIGLFPALGIDFKKNQFLGILTKTEGNHQKYQKISEVGPQAYWFIVFISLQQDIDFFYLIIILRTVNRGCIAVILKYLRQNR